VKRNTEFDKLWAGQAISIFGSGITSSALPLTAALLLGASAQDMGWLLALEAAPVLLIGLFAGVWVDRLPRRPLMILADVGRALLLLTIPLLAVLGSLRIEHLLVVAAATGVLSVLFDVAYRSFVPDLVGREQTLQANSRLASVEAAAEITTPGLTGALVQLVTPPLVILADAVSFLCSAACVSIIRHHESSRSGSSGEHGVWSDATAGLHLVWRDPVLRSLATWEGVRNFFGTFIGAVYVLFGLRELGLSPLSIGITVGVGGASNLLGTLVVPRVTARFGPARTMVGAVLLGSVGPILIASAPATAVSGFVVLVLAQSLDLIYPLYEVNALTQRQLITPVRLLGRVNATMHLVARGVIPFGALAGGALGDALGLRPTLAVAAAGIVVGSLWFARAIWRMRS
jgi:MFS family permease